MISAREVPCSAVTLIRASSRSTRSFSVKSEYFDNINEFIELLHYLFNFFIITNHDNGNPAHTGLLAGTHCKALDIKPPP